MEDLKIKTVIGGRAAGMPEMMLEYILSEKGMDSKEDLVNMETLFHYLSQQLVWLKKKDMSMSLLVLVRWVVRKDYIKVPYSKLFHDIQKD